MKQEIKTFTDGFESNSLWFNDKADFYNPLESLVRENWNSKLKNEYIEFFNKYEYPVICHPEPCRMPEIDACSLEAILLYKAGFGIPAWAKVAVELWEKCGMIFAFDGDWKWKTFNIKRIER